jgi:uncharacterized membrane protein
MAQSKSCEGCGHAHDCSKVYERLGCVEGPSITRPVLLAFLLPILVFIGTLAGFGWLLKDAVAESYQMPLAAALALTTTAVVMLVVRRLLRPHRKQ